MQTEANQIYSASKPFRYGTRVAAAHALCGNSIVYGDSNVPEQRMNTAKSAEERRHIKHIIHWRSG
jgi:hypothetical protein